MEDALHLIDALWQHYQISINWSGEDYCGMKLKWNYNKEYVDMSMPRYIEKALKKFGHQPTAKLQYAPAKYEYPIYG